MPDVEIGRVSRADFRVHGRRVRVSGGAQYGTRSAADRYCVGEDRRG